MSTSRTSAAAVAVTLLCLMTSLVVAQNPKPPTLTDSPECDDRVTLVNNPVKGNLSLSIASLDPIDQDKLVAFVLQSQWRLFIEPDLQPPSCCGKGGFECWCIKRGELEKFSRGGFGSFDIGNVLPTALSGEDLVVDFIVDGSYLTGGTLDKYNPDSPFLYVVPEPSAAILGLAVVVGLLRRRFSGDRRTGR